MVISIYFIVLAREDVLFSGTKMLQTIRDAACVPGLVPGNAGQHRHLQPRVPSSRGGTNQSLAGLLGTGDAAEIRSSGRKHSQTISDQKTVGVLT